MEPNLNHDETINALLQRIGKSRQEVEELICVGEWQVWSAEVTPAGGETDGWLWEFHNDFAISMPEWLDVEVFDKEAIAGAISRARLPVDSRRCHINTEQAINDRCTGYEQAFRIRQRDGSVFWINERVEIQRQGDGSLRMLGICTPASQEAVVEAVIALEMNNCRDDSLPDPLDAMDVNALREYVRKLKSDNELLTQSAQWLTWAAVVKLIRSDPPAFNWSFRSDFTRMVPSWFDVERVVDEDLAITLGSARFRDDDKVCSDNAKRALLSGVSGYNQTFRVRLRDDRVQWIEEHVVIEAISPGKWHLVGVCIDATERKSVERRLELRNEEFEALQGELEAKNEEMEDLRLTVKAEREALAAANARLIELVNMDVLTGVKNYRSFRDQLQVDLAAATRYGTPLSLIVLDIDHFAQFNDENGHVTGDAALSEVGKILMETARECDCVARCGGEEFAVIVPHTDAKGAKALAERFRSAIETAPWRHRPLTVSLGVATTSIDCVDAPTLLARASAALVDAKSAGRNRVVAASPAPPAT